MTSFTSCFFSFLFFLSPLLLCRPLLLLLLAFLLLHPVLFHLLKVRTYSDEVFPSPVLHIHIFFSTKAKYPQVSVKNPFSFFTSSFPPTPDPCCFNQFMNTSLGTARVQSVCLWAYCKQWIRNIWQKILLFVALHHSVFSLLSCFPSWLGDLEGFGSTVANIFGISPKYVRSHHSYHLCAQLWATWVLSGGAGVASGRPNLTQAPVWLMCRHRPGQIVHSTDFRLFFSARPDWDYPIRETLMDINIVCGGDVHFRHDINLTFFRHFALD